MCAMPSSNHPSEKRASFGCATLTFQLLRMFWVTALALLVVVSYGLYAGWSMPRQWSDAFFYAATAQIFIAALATMGSLEEIAAAYNVRYLTKGDINDIRQQIARVAMRRETFSLRVFIGSLLTILIAALFLAE